MVGYGGSVLRRNHVRHGLVVCPDAPTHVPLIELLRSSCRLVDLVFLGMVRRAVLIAKGLEDHAAVKNSKSSLNGLHLEEKTSPPCTSDVESLVAILVATLDACAHSLAADVAGQLPSSLGDLFDIHDRLHERVISQRDFRNPHGAKQMGPFGRIRLLECTVCIGTKYARLREGEKRLLEIKGQNDE